MDGYEVSGAIKSILRCLCHKICILIKWALNKKTCQEIWNMDGQTLNKRSEK